MTSPDRHVVKVGEAESALAFRLQDWGVTGAEEKARAFIGSLLRQGWRPWAPVVALPRRAGDVALPPHELLEQTRAQLRAARPHTDTEEAPNG